jgi:acetoin utilization deacetylase AcuC-like enzyme
MKLYFSDHYPLPIPDNHRFPAAKYRLLKERLLSEGIVNDSQLIPSPLATKDEIRLAHTEDYYEQMKNGLVPHEQMKRVGFPWSEGLFLRSLATVGGAIEASKMALKEGLSGNLAGGTHHSHADRGEGFCVFNDIAVCSRFLHAHSLAKKIAIIDLDVHQGNGNSSILFGDENVFIFSMHGEKNYPYKKVSSHLDIGLPDGCQDDQYLSELSRGMKAIEFFEPDYIFYLMGVDPLIHDKLGTLNISFDGLMERDRIVLDFCFKKEISCSLALGGGYSDPIDHSVRAYANTFKLAKKIFF